MLERLHGISKLSLVGRFSGDMPMRFKFQLECSQRIVLERLQEYSKFHRPCSFIDLVCVCLWQEMDTLDISLLERLHNGKLFPKNG